MPPKKISIGYEKYYDPKTGSPIIPKPPPLPPTRKELDNRTELKYERRAQNNEEKNKKKEEDPYENFEKELQKQAIQQKQRAINKSFKEYESSSDDEEDTNPISVLRRRQKADRQLEKEREKKYPEIKEFEEELKKPGIGASLFSDKDRGTFKKTQVNPYTRIRHSATPQKDNYCSYKNCTIMGGSDDDSPSITEYFDKLKQIIAYIANTYNDKEFIEDLKELEYYRENVLIDLEKPEEIHLINQNIRSIKSLLKILNKDLSNFEELNSVTLDENQKEKLQTTLSDKINFFIAKLEEKESKLYDADINNIRLLNREEPQTYNSPYYDLIRSDRSEYAIPDRKVIRRRTPPSIGGKTKKRKIKKRNKSKKNKRRTSKK